MLIESTDRTCSQCGRVFPSYGARKCLICRAPAVPVARVQVGRKLSNRELQICELIAQAKANKEIAAALKLSEGTIKEYEHRMAGALGSKLMARNRVAIAVWWITEGRAEYQAVQTSANPEAA